MAISSLFIYLFIYLLTKRFRMHMLEVYAGMKNCYLCCLVLAYFCLVSSFLLVTCFCAHEIFLSEEISRLEIVMITSFYYTTLLYYYREFICTYLFLFVIICEDLFFLWESFWISFYLWLSLRIYFLKPLWK